MRAEVQAGFTLVEVLVALVVASLLAIVILDGAADSRARSLEATRSSEAISLARRLVVEARETPFAPGTRAGTAGALRWEMREQQTRTDRRGFFVLSRTEILVRGAGGRTYFRDDVLKIKPAVRS